MLNIRNNHVKIAFCSRRLGVVNIVADKQCSGVWRNFQNFSSKEMLWQKPGVSV